MEPSTGEYVLSEEDLRIRSVGFDFVWKRHYQSRRRVVHQPIEGAPVMGSVADYSIGIPGWVHSYDIWLQTEQEWVQDCPVGQGTERVYQIALVDNVRLFSGNGRADLFKPARACWHPPNTSEYPELIIIPTFHSPGIHATLYHSPDEDPDDSVHEESYELHWQDGGVWHFDAPWPGYAALSYIEDRNGNRMTFLREPVPDPAGGPDWRLLVGIVDTLGRLISIHWDWVLVDPTPWDWEPVITRVVDFTGREVSYGYHPLLLEDVDSDGHLDGGADWNSDGQSDGSLQLASVTLPAVTGTPNGNDFPAGKTRRYLYDSGRDWGQRLTHVVDASGQIVVENEYAENGPYWQSLHPSDPHSTGCSVGTAGGNPIHAVEALPVNRVTRHVLGGDAIHYHYSWEHEPRSCTPDKHVVVNDRMGNVVVHRYDEDNLLRWKREYTGRADPSEPTTIDPQEHAASGAFASNPPGPPLLEGDPPYWETEHAYTADFMREETYRPRGNVEEYAYEGSFRSRSLLPRVRHSTLDAGQLGNGELLGQRVRYDIDAGWWPEYPTGVVDVWGGGYLPEGTVPEEPFFLPIQRNHAGWQTATYFWHDQRGRLRTVEEGVPRATPGPALPGEPSTCVSSVCESYEYDHGADGQGLLTTWHHPDNGNGHRRRDTFEYERITGCTAIDCAQSCTHCPLFSYLSKQVVDADGLALTTLFDHDERGNVTRVVDPKGTVTLLDVNQLDQVVRTTVQFTLPSGTPVEYRTDFTRDERDLVVRVDVENVDDNGQQDAEHPWITTFTKHDLLGRPVAVFQEVEDVEESFWSLMSGDDWETALAAWGPDDRFVLTRSEHDANGNVIKTWSGEATTGRQPTNVTVHEHDVRDEIFRTIHAAGDPEHQLTIQFDRDGNGNLVRTHHGLEDADGPRITTNYFDDFDRLSVEVDAMGNEKRYFRDEAGNVIEERVYGARENDLPPSAPPPLDAPRAEDDVDDQRWCLSVVRRDFDTVNRVIAEHVRLFDPTDPTFSGQCPTGGPTTDPGAWATTRTTYTDAGQVATVTDPAGHVTTTIHDTVGRVHVVTDAMGNRTITEHDENGNVRQVTNEEVDEETGAVAIFVSTTEHDGANRAFRTTDSAGHQTEARHDSRGNVVHATDQRGNTTRFTHDGLGRLVRTEHDLREGGTGEGAVLGTVATAQQWDANSRLVAQVDGLGNATTYTYNVRDWREVKTMADGTVHLVTFDRFGQQVHTTDANGSTLEYEHDDLGRLVARRPLVLGAGVVVTAAEDRFQVDGLGRATAGIRLPADGLTASEVLRRHDSRGLLVEESLNGEVVSYQRDVLGRPVATTLPSGRVLGRTFDELGQVRDVREGVPDAGPCVLRADDGPCYLQQSFVGRRLAARDFGNGTRLDLTHDELGLPWVFDYSKDATTFARHEIVRDPARNKTSWSRTNADEFELDRSFEYDSLNRMVRSFSSGPDANLIDYGLDAAGNRLTVTGGTNPGDYTSTPEDGLVNEYSRSPDSPRVHDANGNLVLRSGLDSEDNRDRLELGHDELNRVVTAETLTETARYEHDAFGRRIGKSVQHFDGTIATLRFFYSGDRIVEEQDENGVTQTTYVHGDRYVDDLVVVISAAHFYMHADDQFTLLCATNGQGGVDEVITYTDYGEPSFFNRAGGQRPGSLRDFRFLYTGRELDTETGFYHYRARYLEPRVGRFTTRDPLGIWADSRALGNGYTYAGNNPATMVDPSGTEAMTFSNPHRNAPIDHLCDRPVGNLCCPVCNETEGADGDGEPSEQETETEDPFVFIKWLFSETERKRETVGLGVFMYHFHNQYKELIPLVAEDMGDTRGAQLASDLANDVKYGGEVLLKEGIKEISTGGTLSLASRGLVLVKVGGRTLLLNSDEYLDGADALHDGIRGMRRAPEHAVVNALRDFKSRRYNFGNQSFHLDRRGMKHILERHHPSYWNGTEARVQTFLPDTMSPDDVADVATSVLRQNRSTLVERGSIGLYQVEGAVDGIDYVVGLNNGRVGQLYPVY